MSVDIVNQMFSEIDINHDGKIEYTEFLKYWREIMIKTHVRPLQKFQAAGKKVISLIRRMSSVSSSGKAVRVEEDLSVLSVLFPEVAKKETEEVASRRDESAV